MKGRIAYIVADMEGSTGAWTRAHTLLGREWQEARVELTRDLNAVSGALFDKGVKGVIVKDFHRTGYNVIPSRLDKKVKLVSGYYSGPAIGYGKMHGADFALFIGLHASGGNEKGFLPHTLTSRIAEIRVNGKRICEAELFAAVLSIFRVPLAFFSGCPAACQEVKEAMGWVATYDIAKDPRVYQDEDRRKAYIETARKNLGKRIKELSDPGNLPLFDLKAPPFDCRVKFHETAEAFRANSWGFPQEGPNIRFQAREFLELYENLLKIAYFRKWAYLLRHIIIPLARVAGSLHSMRHL